MSDQARIDISFEELEEAHEAAGIDADKTEATWQHLSAAQPAPVERSGFAQILWILGAGGMLVPMGLLLQNIGDNFGSMGVFGLSLFYGMAYAFAANMLSVKPGLRVASGLLYVLATCMTPFVVSAAEDLYGKGGNFTLAALIAAVATMIIGNVFTARARISFVCLPPLLAGAAAAVLISNLISGEYSSSWFGWNYDHVEYALIVYGLAACAVSSIIDRRSEEDYAFWGYGVGSIAIWIGLSLISKSEGVYALYAAAGLGSIFLSMLLARPVFGVTGGLAVLVWAVHMLDRFLGQSTIALVLATVIGAIIFGGGLWYYNNQTRVDKAARRFVPKGFRPGLPGEKDED